MKPSLLGLAIIALLLAACGVGKINDSAEPTRAAKATVTPLLPTASLAATDIAPKETSSPTPSSEHVSSKAGGQVTELPPTAKPTQQATPKPRQNTPGLFYSSHVGDDLKIYVELPEGYSHDTDRTYPVIYLLDADWYFNGSHWRLGNGGLVGIVSRATRSGAMPPAILVGIGYPGENRRGRDFLAGVKKFYWFLEKELVPAIDARYRTDLSLGRTLIGHSDGGFCTMYAFFQYGKTPEPLFANYIALSGDYNKIGLMFSSEESLFERMQPDNRLEANVYMAVGSLEESRFKSSGIRLAALLKGREYSGFRCESKIHESYDHRSIVGPGIRDGLRWIFRQIEQSKPAPPQDATPTAQAGSPTRKRSQRYPTPGDYMDRISVKGQPRLFKLHIPYSYQPNEPLPVVLVFHGGGQEIEYLEEMSQMSQQADEADFVTVYPQGLQQRWDIEPRNSGNLDVDFVQALLEHLESELSIDPSRIYATGFSNGGGMAHRLACELSDKLAAIAPISGAYANDLDCKPGRPVPVVAFQGTGDTFVPPQSAEHDTPLWAADWAARNDCDSKPQTSFQENNVTAETWSNCQANATVTLYTIEGGRHIWPGSPMARQFFPDIQDIPATKVIWKFFEEHPMQMSE